MASRISYEPIVGLVPRQRRPRIEDGQHLAFIRQLSCVICGATPCDPAHLRAGNLLIGKRAVGVAEKPDDVFCAPLCRHHHDEQHSMREIVFWRSYGIANPWQLALALFAASVAKDIERAELILAQHRMSAAA